MPPSQLQNIQSIKLWNIHCQDFPPMPRLSQLTMSYEPAVGHAMLPLPKLTMLEELSIRGVDHCPSLSGLARLTVLKLVGRLLPNQASADIPQDLKVCHASST